MESGTARCAPGAPAAQRGGEGADEDPGRAGGRGLPGGPHAHDYLRKPFEPSELLARVHAALRTKQLRDELRLRNAELDVMSRTDSLTRLHNRRHLEERLGELVSLLRRHGGELSLLLIDVDHFKRVNDEHGHATGDAVLRVLAARLKDSIRAEDVPGRWGGEEFVVLLPSTGPEGAHAAGERVRLAVATSPFALAGGGLRVTVSVGVASGIDGGWEGLVQRADAALYAAKEGGRNRVVVAGEPSSAGTPAR